MFLFTTTDQPATPTPPPARTGAPGSPVVDAIRQGAQASGTSFDYLLATAQRESALSPTAKAPTSSATGLFQFIEQTWLGLVKSEGGKLGLGDYANAIQARSDGSLSVGDAGTKQAILKLREDPVLSATLAGTLAQKNGDSLTSELGRSANGADLYVAHVLGARGAAELIKSAQATPTRAAALDFPEAAAANRTIFYDSSGRARGAAEVYNVLGAGQTRGPATEPRSAQVAALGATSVASSTVAAPPVTRQSGPAMYGLFQTDARPGPVSDAVARIWRTNAANAGGPAASAVRFFPRETPSAGTEPEAANAVAEPAAQAAASAPPAPQDAFASLQTEPTVPPPGPAWRSGDIPLPPPRPRTGTLQVRSAAGGPSAEGGPSAGRPLDLLSYMKTAR